MGTLIEFGRRTLSLSRLAPLAEIAPPNEEYVVLLPAYSRSGMVDSLLAARSCMHLRCKEHCCVGPLSEALEDEIDAALEESGLFLSTSSFSDAEEACDYFLFASDAGVARCLLAPVADHAGLMEVLSKKVGALMDEGAPR